MSRPYDGFFDYEATGSIIATGGGGDSDVFVTIISPRDCGPGWFQKEVKVWNLGPGSLTAAQFLASIDGITWHVMDGTTFANLGSGRWATHTYNTDSFRWYKLWVESGTLEDGTHGTVYGSFRAFPF